MPFFGPGTDPRTSNRFSSGITSTTVRPPWLTRLFPICPGPRIPLNTREGVADAFEKGDVVKISGTSKGKGFQGTVKRHNFSRGPVSHGSHNVRAPGSIGQAATPSRVFKGIRGPGQMGNKRRTQKGLEIVEVRADENLLLLRGSVPGPKGSIVEIRSDGKAS